ncbi:MAG TPA: D-alanyl-D-alanine carboxypeptidase, partial [Pseudobdellovibrionaceae bacterium]|nr:D-alanyl-D-alanine carboxypeptidase [Pseudobdellovibrionaceae bacterium]
MIKNVKQYGIFLFLLVYPTTFVWGSIENNLKTLMKSHGVKESEVSIFVSQKEDGGKDQIIIDVNGHQPLIPASVSKLAVSAAVLNEFKAGHLFKTKLVSEAKIESGVLKGDLYLVGGGDPSFVSEKMWYLVNIFIRNGIKVIQGDILVDDTLFDQQRFDSTRIDKRVDNAYDA